MIANGADVDACRGNVRRTVLASVAAGFVVHPEKSVLEPTQQIMYLGVLVRLRQNDN